MIEDADRRISLRLRELREAAGLSLAALAELSKVSKAMISKIERGEASPTAQLLARLANGLGVSLSTLFGEEPAGGVDPDARPFLLHSEQPVWRDPETGYLRRNVSPRGLDSAMEIVEVELPAGKRVMFDNCTPLPLAQLVWLLEGRLVMTVDSRDWPMAPGDCLHMKLDRPLAFANPGPGPARYAVVIETARSSRRR